MVRTLLLYGILFLSSSAFAQEKKEFEVHQLTPPDFGDAYSPSIIGNSIVFCGNKKDRIVYTVIGNDHKEPADLYFFTPDNTAEIKRFSASMRTEYYDGPATFSENGSRCIVSQNIVTDHKFRAFTNRENRLGLNEYRLQDSNWVLLGSLPFNDTSYNCTHPALSSDGTTLFFSSNRPGGMGGYDIWKSTWTDSMWSEPINLGSAINSSGQEVFPTFINERLYFSSNRGVFGGLDIYAYNSERETIEPLQPPLNSSSDDFGLVSSDRLKTGYFSSNRSSVDAIWSFTFLQPVFDACDSLVVNNYCYTLAEENALALDEVPSLVYQWDINGEKRNGIEIDYCFPGPGQYMIQLDIIDTIVNAVYANQAAYELVIEDEEQPYITSLDSVRTNAPFQLLSEETNLPNVEIEDYYWSLSDGSSYHEPNPQHTFREEGTYRVELGILGTLFGEAYEDCVYKMIVCGDSVEMNETNTTLLNLNDLSRERRKPSFSNEPSFPDQADSTQVIYVVEIASSKEKLIVENDLPLDLREDYFIKSNYNTKDSLYSYYIGEYAKITDAHKTWYEIIQRGHEVFVRSRKNDAEEIPLDQAVVMRTILFESNKSEIKDEFKPDLDRIIGWMTQVEALQLVIYAHTDDVGNQRKNKDLSQDRAMAIVAYFIANGIDESRLQAIGYGEERPIASNDTLEGRSQNRRVEFELKMKE